MKFLIATFDHPYYLWQVLVQINNFMKYGYDEDTVYIVATHQPSEILMSIMRHPKTKAKFILYKDERKNAKYPSSLRPHLLERFFNDHKEYEQETILYLDPDVVFTKKLDFSKYLNDDTWYLSDTRSYISSNYIKSKSEKLFNEMCEIAKVTPEEITAIDENAGGAQYLMKGINAEFWEKVYDDSEDLYMHMKKTEHIYSPDNPIQYWTADMWAVLWNAIYFKHEVKIDKDLEFCWSTYTIDCWDRMYIFHNAGIPGDSEEHFSKITYQVSPFNKKLVEKDKYCTFNYVKEIKETEENFKDILW
jgi:hypothetical protein